MAGEIRADRQEAGASTVQVTLVNETMREVTSRQKEVLEYIKHFHSIFRYSPSTRDVSQHFGFNQTAATNHINSLLRKGMVERPARKQRVLLLTSAGHAFLLGESDPA